MLLTKSQIENLISSFPGRDEGERKRVNVGRIYDQKYSNLTAKMYQQIDVFEDDGKNDPVDNAGYTGVMIRKKRKLNPISEMDFLMFIYRSDKLGEVWTTIRKIDRERNGYITSTELDDILKVVFPELLDSDLLPIIKPFCSI